MFHIIYEDDAMLVVHKASGIPVQTRKTGQKDMVSLLQNYRARKGEEPYIAIVHRLDQPVEGVMVFAKTAGAAGNLSRQIAEKGMEKYYHAAVCLPEGIQVQTGVRHSLTDYLLRDGRNNWSAVVAQTVEGAKRAELSYTFLEQCKGFAKVEIELKTGRHHQIRVQFSHAGYPLAGDRKYGGQEALEAAGACPVALCSVRISFMHPDTSEKLEFFTEPQNPIFVKLFNQG